MIFDIEAPVCTVASLHGKIRKWVTVEFGIPPPVISRCGPVAVLSPRHGCKQRRTDRAVKPETLRTGRGAVAVNCQVVQPVAGVVSHNRRVISCLSEFFDSERLSKALDYIKLALLVQLLLYLIHQSGISLNQYLYKLYLL